MIKQRRAPNPSWLKTGELIRLGDFAIKYGGSMSVHHHLKTIRRW